MNQEAKDHAVLMSYDAMRICMGLNPVNATAPEVIRWMEAITGTADSLTARVRELEAEVVELRQQRDEHAAARHVRCQQRDEAEAELTQLRTDLAAARADRDQALARVAELEQALTKISNFPMEPIWQDDRDDAANEMVSIADAALAARTDTEEGK
jgi:chromosome segregation ATPase